METETSSDRDDENGAPIWTHVRKGTTERKDRVVFCSETRMCGMHIKGLRKTETLSSGSESGTRSQLKTDIYQNLPRRDARQKFFANKTRFTEYVALSWWKSD